MSGPGVSGNSSQFVMSSTSRLAQGSQIVIPGDGPRPLRQGGELEHEVIRKAGEVALDRLIQRAGLDPVKRGEIEIQDHFFMANPVDLRSNG